MPISSSAASIDKRKFYGSKSESTEQKKIPDKEKNFLTIGPALPPQTNNLSKRSHSTLTKKDDNRSRAEVLTLQIRQNGVYLARAQKEKEKHPDRISLDRRGLTVIPLLEGEVKLRLLSLQHNLINNLDGLKDQSFPFLVFLDIYDNQLEKINYLDKLVNLRVLLLGKNRIKKIEGLHSLTKIEVLDLHGNQIQVVSGLTMLSELKVLNVAGNQLKVIGVQDLHGLTSLQELNLRRNRIKKLLGFGETPNLQKLFLSNNDVQNVEDMASIAKSSNIRELSIDSNPVFLNGDCVSFLVSFLPHLCSLNSIQITEQVRKAAMAWRRNKETTNATFMDLSSNASLNGRREEVISNARTNWELIRSQTKCLATTLNCAIPKVQKLEPDVDFILTSLSKSENKNIKIKPKTSITRVPALTDKRRTNVRTASLDTDNSQNTSSSNSGSEFFRLPPILVPIINRMEQRNDGSKKEGVKLSGSLSSIGPNVDSSVSSLNSTHSDSSSEEADSSESESEYDDINNEPIIDVKGQIDEIIKADSATLPLVEPVGTSSNNTSDSGSNLSTNTAISNITIPSSSTDLSNSSTCKSLRSVKSAANVRLTQAKVNSRAATAKPKKTSPGQPPGCKEREQGGDYLIEICGRHLNIYGQGALRFIDKPWSASKSNDVTTINFNYANFNGITTILSKIKHRFPNAENFVFKETNIQYLGQLNALAEIQGLISLYIGEEGNPVTQKSWKNFAIYRLSHWGLKIINGQEIQESEIATANMEYQSLSDLVLWSLPEPLLQPLLTRLHIDLNQTGKEQSAKKWLLSADPALRSVVSKEALQWKKGTVPQEDLISRQKAKIFCGSLIDHTCCAINKLRVLDQQWPNILQEIVQNTLLDYSQLDIYMKEKIKELM